MGISKQAAAFLIYAKCLGVDYSQTGTIGRPWLYLTAPALQEVFRRFGHQLDDGKAQQIFHDQEGFAEPLLGYLGAKEIHSFDYSDFEGCTYTHDMNEPIKPEFRKRYTAVYDGGCLEHVFNFPMAIRNCMEMLKVGGHFLAVMPANNYMGHGFYQFSPELLYSILSPENGFEVRQLIVTEAHEYGRWYAAADPKKVNGRVGLMNFEPTYLLVLAQRVGDGPVFLKPPMQSDYVAAWRSKKEETAVRDDSACRSSFVSHFIPTRMRPIIRSIKDLLRPPLRPPLFTPVDLSVHTFRCDA